MENELLLRYSVCEYLLVLHPHEELFNKVGQVKKEFADKYDCPSAYWSKPHITLARFKQYEMMQQRIVSKLNGITKQLSPFKVELKNFGSFPTHTIYINITSKVPIVSAVKAIRQSQNLMKLDKDNKPHFITEPHLTIARKLQPWQFEKAWLEYEQKPFSGRFMANDILLLKRKDGDKGYTTLHKFEFKNEHAAITQGILF